jgi:N-terminal region of glycosyl transferase group 7/N-terminal domain of galactosyltransferase
LPSFDLTNLEERYNKRLAIIVPYRDRYEHLRSFLPHITAYFQRDKLDRQIRYKIYVIEQYGIAPFNRGMLANSGFVLAREENDYFCIHDVDYLPIWADYSWGSAPARLIWHGLVLKENWNNFFGAVVLFDKQAFEAVNGFPNCYWGWGPEDLELGQRFKLSGLDFDRRDGTFMPLPHKHAGFSAPGVWTEEARRTHEVYKKRKDRLLEVMKKDGLNNLSYKVVDKLPLKVNEIVLPESFHYVIDISDQPPSG